MQFLLLLFLTLVCLPDEWSAPWWAQPAPDNTTALVSAALTWLSVGFVVAFARSVAARVTGRLAVYPGHRDRLLRRYGRLRTYHVFLLIGTYALALYGFGWGWTVQHFCGHGAGELPGAELLILAPFLAGLVLSWVVFYDAERALHYAAEPEETDSAEPFWSRGSYVGFHVRQNLALLFAPVLLLLLMKGLRHLFPESEEGPWAAVTLAGGILLSLSVIVSMPWLLRLALGLKPLPPGPLRARLETTARRLRFRCSNILVWDTRNGVANAMVAGVVPWVRYVILTDRLMTELTPDEVEAVFGHEIGHAKHHHMLYYLGFLLVSMVFVGWLCQWLGEYVALANRNDATLQALPVVTVLGAYIFVVFGFLSRRCERQADVYGCRAVSCPLAECGGHDEKTELAPRGRGLCPTGIRTFIEALEKVARLNGISRDNPGWLSSWQHSTIARRVDFLQGVLADRALERRFQRRVALVKWALFLGLAAALALLCYASSLYPPADGAAGEGRPGRHPVPAGQDAFTPRTAERMAPSE